MTEGGRSRVLRAATSVPVRLAVTAGLLAALALAVDWSLVADRLRGGEWDLFVLAVALVVVALVVGAVRWHALLRAAAVESSLRDTLRAYAIGTFSNSFLPQVGGDLARAWIVARPRAMLARAIVSVAVDRIGAVACLILLAWGCVAVAGPAVPSSLVAALAVTTVLGAAGAVAAVLVVRRGEAIAARLLPARLGASARDAEAVLRAYARDGRLAVAALVLGLAYQALIVLSTWLLARSIDVDVPFAAIAAALPVVLAVMFIPISLGGFGLREGGFVVLLADAGVGTSDAALLSVLAFTALALASLPGALALLLPGRPRREELERLRGGEEAPSPPAPRSSPAGSGPEPG